MLEFLFYQIKKIAGNTCNANTSESVLIDLRLKQMITKFLLFEWWLKYDHEWKLIQCDKAEVQPFKCTIIWDGIWKGKKKNALTT